MPPTIHPLSEHDSVAVATLRSAVAPMKGKVEGIAGRSLFDEIMERVAIPDGAPSVGAIRERVGPAPKGKGRFVGGDLQGEPTKQSPATYRAQGFDPKPSPTDMG